MASSIYGLVPNVARLAFNAGIPALESVLVRTLVVAVVLGCVALARQARTGGALLAAFHVPRAGRMGFALQVLATLLVSSCYIAAVQFVPVGVAVLIFFTFPVIIALAAPLIERRPPQPLLIGLALLAFCGLAFAIGPVFAGLDMRGVVLAALAALGCALQFFSGRSVAQHMAPANFGALVHLAILPVIAGLAVFTGQGQLALAQPGVTFVTYGVVALVGISYCAAYFLQMSAVGAAPASTVAPFFNIEPVVTTVMAIILLGEKLTLNHVLGGIMVLAAILAAGFIRPRPDPGGASPGGGALEQATLNENRQSA